MIKFLAISLKASNPFQDQFYRNKYSEKLDEFVQHCGLSNEIKTEVLRKSYFFV